MYTPAGQRLTKEAARLERYVYWQPVDAACADMVATFQGDINAHMCMGPEPLLSLVARRDAPLTLAALAARADIDPYRPDDKGDAPICDAIFAGPHFLRAFLAAFPALDVNAPCSRDECKPLALCAGFVHARTLCLLLDAGAEFSHDIWGKRDHPKAAVPWETNPELAAIVAPHVAWFDGLRRAWMTACVSLACLAALTSTPNDEQSPVLMCMLGDDLLRMCIIPAETSHQLVSELAGLVATFL